MSFLGVIDQFSERAGRDLASRHSRRSLLGNVARAGVALTGVGVIETAFATPAAANHVCGHTGTTPTCSGNPYPNCPAGYTKGGCWFTCGCCGACGRELCDCCKPRCGGCGSCSCCGLAFGYCPSGYCNHCIIYNACTGPCPC